MIFYNNHPRSKHVTTINGARILEKDKTRKVPITIDILTNVISGLISKIRFFVR